MLTRFAWILILGISNIGEVNAMRYGEPFTKYVISGRVEKVFQKAEGCPGPDNVYAFKAEQNLRGEPEFADLIILAPYSGNRVKKGDEQLLFLMDVEDSVPDSLSKCYPEIPGDRMVGYLDYASADGVYRIDRKKNAFSSLFCNKEGHISIADRLFDGREYSFRARSEKLAGCDDEKKCVEISGSYEDLISVTRREFGDISLKPTSPDEAVESNKGRR